MSMVYIGGVAPGVELPAEREEAIMKCRALGARCVTCHYVHVLYDHSSTQTRYSKIVISFPSKLVITRKYLAV